MASVIFLGKFGERRRANRNLIPLWHGVMAWAKEVLVRSYKLDDAKDILGREYRGKNQIPGTNWFYRTHGIGVDVFNPPRSRRN